MKRKLTISATAEWTLDAKSEEFYDGLDDSQREEGRVQMVEHVRQMFVDNMDEGATINVDVRVVEVSGE